MRYNKTATKEKKNLLAISIHKNFVSDEAKFHLSIPDELIDELKPESLVNCPDAQVLKKLQEFAELSLSAVIDQFLLGDGKSPALLLLDDAAYRNSKHNKVPGLTVPSPSSPSPSPKVPGLTVPSPSSPSPSPKVPGLTVPSP